MKILFPFCLFLPKPIQATCRIQNISCLIGSTAVRQRTMSARTYMALRSIFVFCTMAMRCKALTIRQLRHKNFVLAILKCRSDGIEFWSGEFRSETFFFVSKQYIALCFDQSNDDFEMSVLCCTMNWTTKLGSNRINHNTIMIKQNVHYRYMPSS